MVSTQITPPTVGVRAKCVVPNTRDGSTTDNRHVKNTGSLQIRLHGDFPETDRFWRKDLCQFLPNILSFGFCGGTHNTKGSPRPETCADQQLRLQHKTGTP